MALRPRYIFSEDFQDLERYFQSKPHKEVSFRKGDELWTPGEQYQRIHYIQSGIVQNCLDHENGRRKIISFHAAGTVFPGFHYAHYKIEESLVSVALTHVKALEFSQDQFAGMFQENPRLVRHVIDWYSTYTNLLIYDSAHQEYNSSLVRLCNLLYLLLLDDRNKQNYPQEMTQDSLAEILGVSLVNVSRSLTYLREKKIIETSRKKIRILDPQQLMALCSDETI